MNPSIPRLNVRPYWSLLVATAALIIAILFLLFPVEIKEYILDSSENVNYWAVIRQSSASNIVVWVCLGFWIFLPILAIILFLRRQKLITALATVVVMLIASIFICQASGPALTSTYYLQDQGTVDFDQRVYHLAIFVEGKPFDISYNQLVLFECNSADTQCTGRIISTDPAIQMGESAKLSLIVDTAANQLQVKTNDKITFTMDTSTISIPSGLADQEPITADNVNNLTKQVEMNGRTGDERLEWSPDGRMLAVADASGIWLYIFDGTQLSVHSLATHEYITGISFNRSGTQLASADSLDGPLRLWDPTTEQKLLTMDIGYVGDVAFSPQADILAFGRRGDIILQDTGTNNEIAVLRNQDLESLAFSPDGNLLAASGNDRENDKGFIRIWDLEAKTEIALISLENHTLAPTALIFSPDGDFLAYPSERFYPDTESASQVHIWDITHRTEKFLLNLGPYQWVRSIAFNGDGTLLATGSADGNLEIWDPATGKLILTRKISQQGPVSLAFNPAGSILATAGGDGAVRFWSVKP